MQERNRDEFENSSLSFRTVIQIVAMGMGMMLILVGLAMAYGVFRVVHETLLSPENFVRIVDAWAEPIRDHTDELEVDAPLAGHVPEPPPRERRDSSELAALVESPLTPQFDQSEDIPDKGDLPDPDPGDSLESQIQENEEEVPEETGEEGEQAIVEDSAAERIAGDEIVEDRVAQDEAAVDIPPLQDNAIPPNQEFPPVDRSFFSVLDKFLDAIREQDLGRAAGGFLVFLFLLVLVKIPLTILTVGSSILSSVVKSSQVNVWRYKRTIANTKRASRHDNDSPLNVGDLH